MKRSEFVSYWVPVIAWMLVIFSASTDLGSAVHTSRFLGPFLQWVYPAISAEAVAAVQLLMRKAAHVAEYAILAILVMRAVRCRWRASFVRPAAIVLLMVALYAASDEFHQSFNASRSGSPWDVMIDCCGALAGLIVYRIFMRRSSPESVAAARIAAVARSSTGR